MLVMRLFVEPSTELNNDNKEGIVSDVSTKYLLKRGSSCHKAAPRLYCGIKIYVKKLYNKNSYSTG